MSEPEHVKQMRARRRLALAVLLAVLGAMLVVAFGAHHDDLGRLAWLIAGLMLLGTLAFGISLWLLRCPRCGHGFGRSLAGGWNLREKSFGETMVALMRPFSCPRCGFEERSG